MPQVCSSVSINPSLFRMPDDTKPALPSSGTEPVPLKDLTEKFGALHPHDSVETAGHRMRKLDAPMWPVVEGRKLIGMVDDKNPDWKIGGRGHDPKTWKVGQIMNRDVVFCYEDEECAHAQQLMEERDLRFLPVVDREMRIVGIFSREEIEQKASDQTDQVPSAKTPAKKTKLSEEL